tara:strand:- start:32 stop:955 length:924 start_codon:yes stop_codon:yes gene_type:complete
MNPRNPRKNFADNLLDKKLSYYDKQLSIEGDLNLKKLAKPVEGKYTNTLNNIITKYQIEQKHIAEVLEVDTATISKHRNGKGPIGWDMAQMYSKYFIINHAIMVDAFSLLTGKHTPKDKLYYDTLVPGRMPVVGEYNHNETEVRMFDHTIKPMYLTSTMYNHYIFKNAEDWGLSCFIYVDGIDTKPFEDYDSFFVEDYDYWCVLNSPMVQNNVHKGALQNLCVCKLKDQDTVLTGMLYEKPRRNQQSPVTYELVHPYWYVTKDFLPEDRNLNGIELDWATPVLSVIMNPSASGIMLKQSTIVAEEEY